MKNVMIIAIAMFGMSAHASKANLVSGSLENLKNTFRSGSAMSFSTDINKSFVIECNGAYGLMGLSGENYVAYNRIYPAITLKSKTCYKIIDQIKAGKTLSFFWKKTKKCNYFYCKYIKAYSIDKL